jgi:hypothetical protein
VASLLFFLEISFASCKNIEVSGVVDSSSCPCSLAVLQTSHRSKSTAKIHVTYSSWGILKINQNSKAIRSTYCVAGTENIYLVHVSLLSLVDD